MSYILANVAGRAALVSGDYYYDLETVSGAELGSDPMAALHSLQALSDLTDQLGSATPAGALSGAQLDAPVPRPPSVYAVGLNYRGHAEESNMKIPPVPMVFTKYPSCITGPNANVELRSDYCDFEVELVIVIGKGGKNIAAADAWNHVAGVTVGQDFSDRATQFASAPPQFNLGKSFDTFGPTGPVLVSPDSLDNPDGLPLACTVNGELRQQDNTGDLIFDVPALVAYLSEICTLRTGDMVFTGTPSGVGAVEGRFLGDGDVVISTIEGIGTLHNRCVRVADHTNAAMLPEPLKSILGQK